MPLTFLIGGARSGKSSWAVAAAEAGGEPVVFVATAEALDAEFEQRIARHRAERPAAWRVVEEPLELEQVFFGVAPEATVVVDCLSLWVANRMAKEESAPEIADSARRTAQLAAKRPGLTLVVSNEVGMGIVPVNALARSYRDLLGRVNGIWAAAANRAVLVVAGRALDLE